MDNRWQNFFKKFPETVTGEQLPVKLPRFDLDLCDLAGAAADWCNQYLKDRQCPSDLMVYLTKKIINNLKVKWVAEPKLFGYRPDKKDYQALWLMQRVIEELNEVSLNPDSIFLYHQPILTSIWWSSFVLKNSRRQMEDYIAVIPYLHTLFDVEGYGEASFYAVYDGHNGLDAAVYSSMYLHQYLVQSSYYLTDPKYALFEAFYATDRGFTQKTENYNLVSGTTAVCALHRPYEKKLHIGWVGDSIATLWKNGTSLCLVNKHIPERHDETERIKNNGGMVSKCQGTWRVDGQLAVSRAIGDVKYKPHIICEPEIRTLVLDGNEEFLVLCSDGLWGHTTPEDVEEIIYNELLEMNGDVSGVGNKLAFKSKAQGSTDNISVVIVFLQDPKLLVAKRRAVIMETAMEQRNATATLASYGQDVGDFGPETDVDTPDEPTGLSKPKVEGEANVIDESGEDSEEDGGGWNYYNKSTEGTEKKANIENDNNTGNNSDTEDMDYKLNPDAPEFVPVSSPTLPITNHAQRFAEIDNDDFISSSPQKFKESIDNVDLPDENDFTNEIKVHAADLSKLDNTYESSDDFTALNDIKPLKEEVISQDEGNVDSFLDKNNEHINNENVDTLKNPFTSDANIDLNKVQDLSEYQNDNAQTYDTDSYVPILEMPKTNEFNLSNDDNVCQNESNTTLNNDFSVSDHIKYEQDMNLKNIDDTINIANATVGSTSQLDDESFKHSGDFKNEFMEKNHNKFGLYEDCRLNDSVSTTDAILGSEPNTPMRMDNQSTFESENDDDQFSESFKQQLQFNQFDEQNNKENHDPFCFTEDSTGIIPNVTQEVNENNESHQIENNVKPNDFSSNEHVSELNKCVPVEEPLCVKEEAKPFHSVYEQQDLPESDFPTSTHEALLNATESEFNHLDNSINTEHAEQQNVENHIKNNEEYIGHIKVECLEQELKVPSHATEDIELDDSDVDEVKDHVADLEQEFYRDNTSNFEQDNNSTIYNENENILLEHSTVKNIPQYFEDIKQDNFDVNKIINDYNDSKVDYHIDTATIQNNFKELEEEFHNNVAAGADNLESSQQNDQFCVEAVPNDVEDIVEAVQSHVEDFEQEHHDVLQVENNYVDDFKHENVAEFKNYGKDFQQRPDNFTETTEIYNDVLQQEHHNIESVQNHITDSDEEMHSSMIIHADVENNMPQPYCSAHDTLMNEPDMMCTSMTFEENFQNRNMSDSLYVMETSSDYFGDDVQQTIQLDKPVDEYKVDEQILNAENAVESSTQIENEIVTETKPELVSESHIDVVTAESSHLLSQNLIESVDKQENSNEVGEIAVAAVAGTAAIAAAAGVVLASKKSAPKKVETTVSKTKTTTSKTTPTKPLVSKTTTSTVKKTSLYSTSKPLSRPTTAPSTSKPTTNVRSTVAPKTTTTLKVTNVTKTSSKPAPKTTSPTSRPTSAKTTPTTPRVTSLTKTTPTLPKTSPTSPKTSKTTTATKSATTPKTSTTQRISLVSKQSLTNGSPKSLSRPISAPAKKPLSSSPVNGTSKLTNGTTKLTNGTTKLTNGDVSKTSTTAKPPVSLATRMSLAPPKLPPKTKVAPKTVIPPAMPGPIRRPKALTPKKTETATS